jgi:hypothetical protein
MIRRLSIDRRTIERPEIRRRMIRRPVMATAAAFGGFGRGRLILRRSSGGYLNSRNDAARTPRSRSARVGSRPNRSTAQRRQSACVLAYAAFNF